MRREDRPSFARAVWEEFSKLSGTERAMTSKEWHMLTGWMDPQFDSEGRMIRDTIPLPVILRAFSEFQGTPRVLTAMEGPVQKAYAYWFKAMGGL